MYVSTKMHQMTWVVEGEVIRDALPVPGEVWRKGLLSMKTGKFNNSRFIGGVS